MKKAQDGLSMAFSSTVVFVNLFGGFFSSLFWLLSDFLYCISSMICVHLFEMMVSFSYELIF